MSTSKPGSQTKKEEGPEELGLGSKATNLAGGLNSDAQNQKHRLCE